MNFHLIESFVFAFLRQGLIIAQADLHLMKLKVVLNLYSYPTSPLLGYRCAPPHLALD